MATLYMQGISLEQVESLIRKTIVDVLDETLQREQNNVPKEKEYYSRKQVAKQLGVSLPTLHKLTQEGKINAYRIGNRVLYKALDIDNALIQVKSLKYNRYERD